MCGRRRERKVNALFAAPLHPDHGYGYNDKYAPTTNHRCSRHSHGHRTLTSLAIGTLVTAIENKSQERQQRATGVSRRVEFLDQQQQESGVVHAREEAKHERVHQSQPQTQNQTQTQTRHEHDYATDALDGLVRELSVSDKASDRGGNGEHTGETRHHATSRGPVRRQATDDNDGDEAPPAYSLTPNPTPTTTPALTPVPTATAPLRHTPAADDRAAPPPPHHQHQHQHHHPQRHRRHEDADARIAQHATHPLIAADIAALSAAEEAQAAGARGARKRVRGAQKALVRDLRGVEWGMRRGRS